MLDRVGGRGAVAGRRAGRIGAAVCTGVAPPRRPSAWACATPATMLSAVTVGSIGESTGASAAAAAATSGVLAGISTTEYTVTGWTIWLLFRSTSTPGSAGVVRAASVCRSPSFGMDHRRRPVEPSSQSRSFFQVQVAG